MLTRGGEQPLNLSEHAELIIDSEAVKSDGASRRVQHFVELSRSAAESSNVNI